MALLSWNASLALGYPSIDKQHQQLLSLMNELHEAARERRAKDVVGKILASLLHYTKTHFAEEEAFMAKNGYPGLAGHRTEHQTITTKVAETQRRFLAGEDSMITIELMEFLNKWLVGHIQGTDKQYATYIAQKSATATRPIGF